MRTQLHPLRYYPSTQSIPTWSIDGYSAIVMLASTDIAFDGESVPKVWLSTAFSCQKFDSVCDIRSTCSSFLSDCPTCMYSPLVPHTSQ